MVEIVDVKVVVALRYDFALHVDQADPDVLVALQFLDIALMALAGKFPHRPCDLP
jgi:hypothetical protein